MDPHERTPSKSSTSELGRCIVCLKRIHPGEQHVRVYHDGRYVLTCCASCAAKFEANPGQYLVA